VKGQWRYLYRAVDKTGQTIDFLLTEQRDEWAAREAVERDLIQQALSRHHAAELGQFIPQEHAAVPQRHFAQDVPTA
jgi:hypothetical protein